MAGETCPFPKSRDPKSVGGSMISSMTTEKDDAGAIWPRCFNKYFSYSFFDPTDIALQLAPDCVARGHRLATIQSHLYTTSLSIQMIPHSAKLCTYARSTWQSNQAWVSSLSQNEQIP